MASSVSRFLPKQVPTDVWSLREKLALACAVKRSGDNNWVSVSRAIKPYGEANRPSDWFSQKNCALQYSDLLEKVETPKRKRGERENQSTESPGDIIIRKLTIERIEELKRIVQEEEQRYKRLKSDVIAVLSGEADERLDEMQEEIDREKKAALEAERKWSEDLAAREQAKQRNRKVIPGVKVKVEPEDSPQQSPADVLPVAEDDVKPKPTLDMKTPANITPDSAVVKQEETTNTSVDAGQVKQEPQDSNAGTTDVKSETGEDTDPKEVKQTSEDCTKTSITEPVTEQKVAETETENVQEKKQKALENTAEQAQEDEKRTTKSDQESTTKSKATDKVTENDNKDTRRAQPEVTQDDVTLPAATTEQTSDNKQEVEDKEILVQVVDEKEIKEPERAESAVIGQEETGPLSPASSVMSNDTDGGIAFGRGRARRRQGGKTKGGRRSLRTTRGRSIVEEDKAKESETSSKAESTDDENMAESDETASNTTTATSSLTTTTTTAAATPATAATTTTRQQQISVTDSLPSSPASVTPGDTEDEKAFKLWKKSIMLVWRAAANHKYANVFSHPVTEEIAPGYHSVVYRPLDLATIKKHIETGVIRTTVEFQRDMMQMFTNAIMYNNSDHDVCHMATEMYDDVLKHIEQYVHTQLLVQGGDAKLLRPSRRSEAHSDKEDEPKRKLAEADGGKAKKRKT